MGIAIAWIVLSFVVGFVGDGRKIGFFGAFALSLIFSPLVGILITLASSSKAQIEYQQKMLNLQKQQIEKQNETQSPSIADEIRKLNDLKNEGLITDDEFNQQRSRILGQ